MIQDQIITAAVPKILQRSERQTDLEKLSKTFVDVGILPQVNNHNNQVVYGRRGTGKTHVLKKLLSELSKDKANAVVYIDARTLGSSSQFSDITLPLAQRCNSLFRDILLETYNGLLEHITDPQKNASAAMETLCGFSRIVFSPTIVTEDQSVKTKQVSQVGEESNSNVGLDSSAKIKLSLGNKESTSLVVEEEMSAKITKSEKILFPDINNLLQKTLHEAKSRLFLLIDEWSSLPADIQPYLAEFTKRALLPNPLVTVKFAALEYRTHFLKENGGTNIGIELGADVSASLDIDDYYVYDKSPTFVVNAFSDMLYKHLASELPEKFLESTFQVKDSAGLTKRMFSEKSTFIEMVRASEGVARDLINIFSGAFFDAQRRNMNKIDKKAVIESARQWYEKDKERDLADDLKKVLERIINEVIGKRSARSFLLRRDLERHPVIQRLFDMRVLHLMQRGYADKDNPGVRYNIYTLDYGTYVDLKNSSREPQIEFLEFQAGQDLVVPFDDKRSIRRIILPETVLNGG